MLVLASTLALVTLSFAFIVFLALFHLPLPWPSAAVEIDGVYLIGNAMALALGIAFLSAYAWRVARERRAMADALAATQMSLARAQRMAALDGLAAGAAHELGTPIGTIALVAHEIERTLPDDHPLSGDVRLISAQAARCGDILARLSRDGRAGTDAGLVGLKLSAFLAALAASHGREGPAIEVMAAEPDEPVIVPLPELTQGLTNLIDNAADFARSRIRLGARSDASHVALEVSDDGPGFSREIVGLLGEPFLRHGEHRAGSGLGVFIAVTLLERTGASVAFENGPDGGALVRVRWPRALFDERLARDGISEHG